MQHFMFPKSLFNHLETSLVLSPYFDSFDMRPTDCFSSRLIQWLFIMLVIIFQPRARISYTPTRLLYKAQTCLNLRNGVKCGVRPYFLPLLFLIRFGKTPVGDSTILIEHQLLDTLNPIGHSIFFLLQISKPWDIPSSPAFPLTYDFIVFQIRIDKLPFT